MMTLLPMCGIVLVNGDLGPVLDFFPLPGCVVHAGFSWLVFVVMASIVVAVITPLAVKVALSRTPPKLLPRNPYPRWWRGAVLLCLVSWILAWTRFDWFARVQPFTFFPLWLGYIGVVNGVTYRRSGRCMLTHRSGYLVGLFLFSALFWWFFEYLNRYVRNWYYTGVDGLSLIQYALFATLSFTTVLPAVLSTYEMFVTFPGLSGGLDNYLKVDIRYPRVAAGGGVCIGCAGLLAIGIWPEYLYPLLWLSPLIIVTGIQRLLGRATIFTPLKHGNWKRLFLLAISALFCGLFWEMWNSFSYAKWIYSIPLVQRFHIFEMPLLGYAGYLTFGLECGVAADLLHLEKAPSPVPFDNSCRPPEL
ncbi:hypothetical protein [Desulforhopalus singaporensis]|uniref:hypothetical protein n=1 Tax=Desulforhopalus singaporensis TaxID=91360 RepID=UPI00115FAC1E|nr:hypothetical protein [Desulforhopalus singaporensis]